MGLIQNDNLILEKIRIVDALTNKNTICYVPQSSRFTSTVVESDRISNLFSHFRISFIRYSVGHANGCHSTRLSYDDIYFLDWFDDSPCVLLNLILVILYRFKYSFWVHHILRELGWFTWTCITSHNTEIILGDDFLYFCFVFIDRKFFLKLSDLLLLHWFLFYELAEWKSNRFLDSSINYNLNSYIFAFSISVK